MWTEDAPGEVEHRILQRQQPDRRLSERAVYVSGLYFSAQRSAQYPIPPAVYQLLAGGKQRCAETDEADSTGLAHAPTHVIDVGGSGTAMQPDHTGLVELLWGVLSALDARLVSLH